MSAVEAIEVLGVAHREKPLEQEYSPKERGLFAFKNIYGSYKLIKGHPQFPHDQSESFMSVDPETGLFTTSVELGNARYTVTASLQEESEIVTRSLTIVRSRIEGRIWKPTGTVTYTSVRNLENSDIDGSTVLNNTPTLQNAKSLAEIPGMFPELYTEIHDVIRPSSPNPPRPTRSV